MASRHPFVIVNNPSSLVIAKAQPAAIHMRRTKAAKAHMDCRVETKVSPRNDKRDRHRESFSLWRSTCKVLKVAKAHWIAASPKRLLVMTDKLDKKALL